MQNAIPQHAPFS